MDNKHFLSYVQLNPSRRNSRYLLGSQQRLHAAVLACFPFENSERRVLWRLDKDNHMVKLYIFSPERPDLTHLIEDYGYPMLSNKTSRIADFTPVFSKFEKGQKWRFRVTANPIKRKRDENNKIITIPLYNDTAQTEWLTSRQKDMGVIFDNVAISSKNTVKFQRNNSPEEKGGTVTINMTQYEGTLTIEDPILFAQTMMNGVGKAKGYGCGLFTITK